jgi:hypothetical protein
MQVGTGTGTGTVTNAADIVWRIQTFPDPELPV